MKIDQENYGWRGIIQGIPWLINSWHSLNTSTENKDWHWAYYLYIALDYIPAENDPDSYWLSPIEGNYRLPYYDYDKLDVLNRVEWHGGMTWYSKECGFESSMREIKVGCDYLHFDDLGIDYTKEDIYQDVKKTIDDFLALVPNYNCNNEEK